MTILITGASGLLGRCLLDLCDKKGLKYIGAYNTRKIKNGLKINFEDETQITNSFVSNEIKICINCIVQRQVEICENNWEETKNISAILLEEDLPNNAE